MITTTTEDGDNKQNDIVKALINQIMHKSQYTGPLLTSTRTLGGIKEIKYKDEKQIIQNIENNKITIEGKKKELIDNIIETDEKIKKELEKNESYQKVINTLTDKLK